MLSQSWVECSGRSVDTLACLKRIAGDTVSLAVQAGEGHWTPAQGKTLQEEAACLRRIKRLVASIDNDRFPDCKVLLMSGAPIE